MYVCTQDRDRRTMLFEERLEAAERRRLEGNALFAEGKHKEALAKYALVSNQQLRGAAHRCWCLAQKGVLLVLGAAEGAVTLLIQQVLRGHGRVQDSSSQGVLQAQLATPCPPSPTPPHLVLPCPVSVAYHTD